MPGVDIGAIMSAVGAMFMDALVNALTNTLTQLITGAISSIANSIAESVSGLHGPLSFIGDAIATFAHNLAAELNEATATLLNAVNAWAHDTIPILKNQQDLSNLIVGQVAEQVDALKKYLEFQIQQQYKAGAAFTDFLLHYVAGREERMEDFVNQFYSYLQNITGQDVLRLGNEAEEFWNFIASYLMADLKRIEALPDEELQAISGYLAEYARDHIKEIRTWFREVVVVPVSMANALRSAFTEGVALSPDEYADMLLLHQEAVDKATQKYMEKLEKKLEEAGAT